MIDLKDIYNNQEKYISSLQLRHINVDMIDIFSQYNKLKLLKNDIDLMNNQRNELTKQLNIDKKQWLDISLMINYLKDLKENLIYKEKTYNRLNEIFLQEYIKLPNDLSMKDYYFSSGWEKKQLYINTNDFLKSRKWLINDVYFDWYITLVNILKSYFNSFFISKGFVHIRPLTIYDYDSIQKKEDLIYSHWYNRFNDYVFVDDWEILLLNAYYDTVLEMDSLPLRNLSLINNIFDNSCCGWLISLIKPKDYMKELELYKNLIISFFEQLEIPFVIQKQEYELFPLSSNESLLIKIYMPWIRDFVDIWTINVSKDYLARRSKTRFKLINTNEYIYSISCKMFDSKNLILAMIENFYAKNNRLKLPKALSKIYWNSEL